MAIKFATKSNAKGEGVLTLEDFKAIGATSKRVVKDLTFKDGSFTIGSSFIKDQDANTGWTVGFDEDVAKVYLVKTTLTGVPEAKFLKGAGVSRKFTSDALEVPLKAFGIDVTKELFLNKLDENTYEVSNTEEVEEVARDNGQVLGETEVVGEGVVFTPVDVATSQTDDVTPVVQEEAIEVSDLV